MCSLSHVRIVSSGMSISQKRKKRERSRENGRRDPGEDQALLSSWGNLHHCTMHHTPCTNALCTMHHAPCTTGATGTAGNLPVGNLEQVGWDSHCQCAFPRTSLFILIISYIGYWKSIFLCYLDDDLVIIISSRVGGNFGNSDKKNWERKRK